MENQPPDNEENYPIIQKPADSKQTTQSQEPITSNKNSTDQIINQKENNQQEILIEQPLETSKTRNGTPKTFTEEPTIIPEMQPLPETQQKT